MSDSITEALRRRYEEADQCQRCERAPKEVQPSFSSYFAVCKRCYRQMSSEKAEASKPTYPAGEKPYPPDL